MMLWYDVVTINAPSYLIREGASWHSMSRFKVMKQIPFTNLAHPYYQSYHGNGSVKLLCLDKNEKNYLG